MFRMRKLLSAISLAGVCSGWLLLIDVAGGRAQPAQRSAATEQTDSREHYGAPASGARQSIGIARCSNCHSKQDVNQSFKELNPLLTNLQQMKEDGWVLNNELRTWIEYDKHNQAYTVLLNERSQRMAELLGVVQVVDGEKKSLIHRDQRCLACHSVVPHAQLSADAEGLISAELTEEIKITYGVSCEGCHGPAGDGPNDVKGWVDAHISSATWRPLPAEDKYHRFGYWDVRSPVIKAKICLSCHLGNVAQGKIITHEMYAAGHPPLPSFELLAFVAQQPQHWRDFGAKEEKIRDDYLTDTGTAYDPDALHRTKESLVGAMVSLSESLQLTADLIDENVVCQIAKPQWPELANFACYACHHELKTPAWRRMRGEQMRQRGIAPGRPLLQEWPLALAEVAAGLSGTNQQEFDAQLQPVWHALSAQPFGRSDELRSAARQAAAWIEGRAWQLSARDLDRDDGRRVLQAICAAGSSNVIDYDSARQLVWAFERIYAELAGRSYPATNTNTSANQPGLQQVPIPWPGWLGDRQNLDEIEQILASLESSLLLDLRTGRSTAAREPVARDILEVELHTTLPMIADYDPNQVQKAFQALAEALKD